MRGIFVRYRSIHTTQIHVQAAVVLLAGSTDTTPNTFLVRALASTKASKGSFRGNIIHTKEASACVK